MSSGGIPPIRSEPESVSEEWNAADESSADLALEVERLRDDVRELLEFREAMIGIFEAQGQIAGLLRGVEDGSVEDIRERFDRFRKGR